MKDSVLGSNGQFLATSRYVLSDCKKWRSARLRQSRLFSYHVDEFRQTFHGSRGRETFYVNVDDTTTWEDSSAQ